MAIAECGVKKLNHRERRARGGKNRKRGANSTIFKAFQNPQNPKEGSWKELCALFLLFVHPFGFVRLGLKKCFSPHSRKESQPAEPLEDAERLKYSLEDSST
jgi:hypothetical protein